MGVMSTSTRFCGDCCCCCCWACAESEFASGTPTTPSIRSSFSCAAPAAVEALWSPPSFPASSPSPKKLTGVIKTSSFALPQTSHSPGASPSASSCHCSSAALIVSTKRSVSAGGGEATRRTVGTGWTCVITRAGADAGTGRTKLKGMGAVGMVVASSMEGSVSEGVVMVARGGVATVGLVRG
ncbi:hypothetical protein BC567DRAFT_229026 [Phyllosticta citribraziliensis]